jgi:hypothetical protein
LNRNSPIIRKIILQLTASFKIIIDSLKGLEIKKKGVQKYVARVKEYGRIQRRHSSFYVGLYSLPISEVKPILDLLSQDLSTSFDTNQTIGNLLKQSPHLGKLSFDSLDLKSYNLDSIPNLSSTAIASFDKWQGVYISEIPGLSKVPFSQFPNPINPVGAEFGIVDVAFATDEQKRNRTISGSDREGFAVPCDRNCAHTQLSGSQKVKGKAWISCKYQLVKGGKGILGSVNGGKEPTGRNLFGDAFKVAVWDVSEVDGMISQSLFFRVCMRNNFIDLGCTPYFIGPVPFMTYRDKEPIFLGNIDENKNSISTPTGLTSSGFRFNNSPITTSKSNDAIVNLIPASKENCKNIHVSGINIDALSSALSNTQNNYNFVGNYVCDSSGNCGRAIGAMQFSHLVFSETYMFLIFTHLNFVVLVDVCIRFITIRIIQF